MKTTDPRKSEKKTPPETDTTDRKLPAEDQTAGEFIGEEADWSEDISEYRKKKQ